MHGCTQSACSHSGFSIPYPPVGCTRGLHGSGADGRARRRRPGKRAVCACLWRADACAQGVPVVRGVHSVHALRLVLRAGPKQGAVRVDSVTSQCVLLALPRWRLSTLTRCARWPWPVAGPCRAVARCSRGLRDRDTPVYTKKSAEKYFFCATTQRGVANSVVCEAACQCRCSLWRRVLAHAGRRLAVRTGKRNYVGGGGGMADLLHETALEASSSQASEKPASVPEPGVTLPQQTRYTVSPQKGSTAVTVPHFFGPVGSTASGAEKGLVTRIKKSYMQMEGKTVQLQHSRTEDIETVACSKAGSCSKQWSCPKNCGFSTSHPLALTRHLQAGKCKPYRKLSTVIHPLATRPVRLQVAAHLQYQREPPGHRVLQPRLVEVRMMSVKPCLRRRRTWSQNGRKMAVRYSKSLTVGVKKKKIIPLCHVAHS